MDTTTREWIDDDEHDQFFANYDVTPDDDAERQEIIDRSREFAERCVERVEHLQYLGTNTSARDIDAIRQALDAVGWPQATIRKDLNQFRRLQAT